MVLLLGIPTFFDLTPQTTMTSTGNAPVGQEEKRGCNNRNLPETWRYHGITPELRQNLPGKDLLSFPPLEGPHALQLGNYRREYVSNVDDHPKGRAYFDLGLRLMLSYQHELAAKCFLASLEYCPYCALAHGLTALCHSPNYNFKGQPYYESSFHVEEVAKHDLLCIFPSQQVAHRHGKLALQKISEIRKKSSGVKNKGKGKSRKATATTDNSPASRSKPSMILDVEVQLLSAIRILTGSPGIDACLSEETVGRPFADNMKKVYEKYPDDPDVVYCYVESLMVLNAWKLYEYPSGKPMSPDVLEVRNVLEKALEQHPRHPGLCHMYVHLSEMSDHPQLALKACETLRADLPDAGHLVHMPTHIDVLVGDYEACVSYNCKAIQADRHVMTSSPFTAEKESFYFGYIVHDYHMAVYGAILGGMEKKAMEVSNDLNTIVNEEMFNEFPDLAAYLETYSALEIHTMIRFGRWKELLEVVLPKNQHLMLYRSASITFGRALAFAVLGDVDAARKEAERFDLIRQDPDAEIRILHNNTVKDLLEVDSVMMHGEIAYREGKYDEAFSLLRKAVDLQGNLNYDEPWGKMQPIRHALGGLLLEQGHVQEATEVFRKDLCFHPKNPWAVVGLMNCLKITSGGNCCRSADNFATKNEIAELEEVLRVHKQKKWVDYDVVVACECCRHPKSAP